MPDLSTRCPYCFSKVRVKAVGCGKCGIEVTGDFTVPRFLDLSTEQQQFAVEFLMASGSLKEMATLCGISYPTVRARLDRIIECLQGDTPAGQERRAAILDAVEEKRISTTTASELLGEHDQEEDSSDG